jgi:hypothetical protein
MLFENHCWDLSALYIVIIAIKTSAIGFSEMMFDYFSFTKDKMLIVFDELDDKLVK